MKILVVDDSLLIRRSMKSTMEELGHSVILAANGEEAIEKYKEEKPNLVTMDLTMPVMNGLDALKHLIKIDPNAKVIISTANSINDSLLSSMKEGASGYILKPITIEMLKEAIDKAINHPVNKETDKQ